MDHVSDHFVYQHGGTEIIAETDELRRLKRRRIKMVKRSRFAAWLLVCVVLGFVFILPFFWMVSTSLMGTEQIVKYPPEFIPAPATLRSFEYIFKSTDFFIYLKNSCIITA